jgi:hypothetical protein
MRDLLRATDKPLQLGQYVHHVNDPATGIPGYLTGSQPTALVSSSVISRGFRTVATLRRAPPGCQYAS